MNIIGSTTLYNPAFIDLEQVLIFPVQFAQKKSLSRKTSVFWGHSGFLPQGMSTAVSVEATIPQPLTHMSTNCVRTMIFACVGQNHFKI